MSQTKKTTRKVVSIMLAAAMIICAMASSVVSFAATDDATRQANSSATATIDLEKTLTLNQSGKFPNVSAFHFTFERIKGWKNANQDTAQNGEALALTSVPMPAAVANHIAVSGNVANVTNSDYSTAITGDTATARSRSTSLPITYTDAGYYVYKVDEVNDGVNGVYYDKDSYYVVVYVCNNKDIEGQTPTNDTTTGVYVHSITVWQNEPDLTDIKGLNAGEDIAVDQDSTAAHKDKGAAPWDTKSETGKLNLSTATDPDAITVNFDNLSETHDVIVYKNVKGSLGDKTKKFEFTVTLTGLIPGTAYTLSDNVAIKGTPTAGTWDGTANTITATAQGNATFTCYLTDDQDIKIEGLPTGATYTVSEASSDHIASYAVTSSEATGSTIATASGANAATQTALATGTESVDRGDGTVTVAYTNTRDITTITGVPSTIIALIAAGAVAALVAAMFVARRRNFDED